MLLEKSLAAIFALLLMATVVNKLLGLFRPGKDAQEVRLRIRSWWIIVLLFSLAILSPYWLTLTFFAWVSFMALKEFLSLAPSRHSDRIPLFWLFISIPVNYWLVGNGWYEIFVVFIPVYVFSCRDGYCWRYTRLFTHSVTASLGHDGDGVCSESCCLFSDIACGWQTDRRSAGTFSGWPDGI